MSQTAVLGPHLPIVWSRKYSNTEYRPAVIGQYRPIVWSRKNSNADYRRWAFQSPHLFARQAKKTKAMSQRAPRRDSCERIQVCQHNNHEAKFQDIDYVLIRTDSNESQRPNMIAARAIKGIKIGFSKPDRCCSLGVKCQGTVKLVWYASGRLRGRDDVFHVVDSIAQGFQAVIYVPESSVSSSPDSEGAYPIHLGKESKEERARREQEEAVRERRRKAEIERRRQEEKDRQLAKKAQYFANPRAISAGH